MEKQTFSFELEIRCLNVIKTDENNSRHFPEMTSLTIERHRKRIGRRTVLAKEDGSWMN